MLCTQKYTSPKDPDVNDFRSFTEAGGTSIDAVLMTQDILHAFAIHSAADTTADGSSDAKNADKLPLLLDRILHCSLSNVVQYISSHLCYDFNDTTSDTSAYVTSGKVDEEDDKYFSAVEILPEDIPIKPQIAASIQSDTTYRTGLSSNADHQLQPVHDTKLASCDGSSESVCTAALEPPVKRPRTTTLNADTLTDAELTCTEPGQY